MFSFVASFSYCAPTRSKIQTPTHHRGLVRHLVYDYRIPKAMVPEVEILFPILPLTRIFSPCFFILLLPNNPN